MALFAIATLGIAAFAIRHPGGFDRRSAEEKYLDFLTDTTGRPRSSFSAAERNLPVKIDDADWHLDTYGGDVDAVPSLATHIGLFFAWCLARDGVATKRFEHPDDAAKVHSFLSEDMTATELVERWDGKLFDHFLKPPIREFARAYYAASSSGVGGHTYLDDDTALAAGDMYLKREEPGWKAEVFALLDGRYSDFNLGRI